MPNLWLLMVLTIVSLNGCSTLDFCREYGIATLAFNSFYCIDYCCGTCNFRYCCSNETFVLDQDLCTNTINQQPLQVVLEKPTKPAQLAAASSLSKKILMVAQSVDSEPSRDTCQAFTDQQGLVIAARECPLNARFCCGTCQNRVCCSLARNRLYQSDCKSTDIILPDDRINPSQLSTSTYINIIIILGVVLALTFVCTPILILVNRRARIRSSNSNSSNMHRSSINNLSILSSASSMSLSSVSSIPKIQQNPSAAEDVPPPYVSLKFNQK